MPGWSGEAPARQPLRLWTTIFGAPRSHWTAATTQSHAMSGSRSIAAGCREGSTQGTGMCPTIPGIARSETMASMPALSMIGGSCSAGTSDGQITNRRATPSNSMRGQRGCKLIFRCNEDRAPTQCVELAAQIGALQETRQACLSVDVPQKKPAYIGSAAQTARSDPH